VVVAREDFSHPAAKGRRTLSDIHGDIEYLALEYIHQFALGVFELIVEATEYTPQRVGIIVLYKQPREVCLSVPFGLPGFHEEAAGIRKNWEFNETHIWQDGLVYFHPIPFS
jgi:hypothetical protein